MDDRTTGSTSGAHTPTIFLSAGEASGEHYAVELIEAIRREAPRSVFFGLGGRRMEALGFRRIVRAEDVAVMGITEILRHIPRIYREYRKLKRALRETRPDVAVLIDFPDVNLGLARECRRLGIPTIFFVSPQVWAWKKHRLKQIRANIDRMLVIFPFEEPFYRERGVAATFVGHPLAALPLPAVSREQFAVAYGLDPSFSWVGLLPGSRPREIALNLPGMIGAAALVERQFPGETQEWLLPLAPTLTETQVTAIIAQLRSLGANVREGREKPGTAGASDQAASPALAQPRVTLTRDARATLWHARASVVASGTATVEAALIGNPFVVVYRVSAFTYAIAKRIVTVAHVAMVNLVAGRRAVPELVQDEFTSAKVASALGTLLKDTAARQTMVAELARVAGLLAAPGRGAIASVAAATLAAAASSTSTQHMPGL